MSRDELNIEIDKIDDFDYTKATAEIEAEIGREMPKLEPLTCYCNECKMEDE